MAAIMTKRGNLDNVVAYEFICDSVADLADLDPKYITMGSTAIIINGTSGFEVYMANSQGQWINLAGGLSAEEDEP